MIRQGQGIQAANWFDELMFKLNLYMDDFFEKNIMELKKQSSFYKK